MRVLFICSGNNKTNGISPFIQSQADSLVDAGLHIDFFIITQPGIAGYFKHIFKLRRLLQNTSFDLVHAHYSLSAIVAGLAGAKPLVVSLLGSDAYIKGWMRWLTKWFYKHKWIKTIVKTSDMKARLKMDEAIVLPNGVNINNYKPIEKQVAREKIKYTSNKKLVLFLANPKRHEKNYPLALQAFKMLDNRHVELMPVYGKPSEIIPFYMNAADVLLLTSKWEGSVNVVKEAMACNLPIVSTDVGDVKENIKDINGCYIASNDPVEIAGCISKAMDFNSRTNGRERLISLGLDSETVANKLIAIYKKLLDEK
ncbi:MAG: glycosyltransferase family 4 protein [Bacteroidales bacterium]|jgi:glycosyltransferase involved in cell wall biosynthesis|nr:glycosyltransferase family 4 protein [Bacteroidales bacterium]